MNERLLRDHEIPYFSWDRQATVGEIRARPAIASGLEWVRLAAWIMREAAFADVWRFLNPKIVRDNLAQIEPFLGRKRDFWRYIIGVWHELGKI